MSICKSENKKKRHIIIAGLSMFALLVVFALTAAAFSRDKSAYAGNGATYKETAYSESANPCGGTHTDYTAVSASGGTIDARGNYYLNGEVSGAIKVTAKDVTLCLNGHDINASNTSGKAALFIEGVNFTLHDCGTNVRYYKIDSATKLFTFEGATETDNDGNIIGGAIRGSSMSGIETVQANVHLLGGNVVGNKAIGDYGGAGAYISDSQAVIKNMNFIGNVSGSAGGGLHINGERTTVSIKDSIIRQNNAAIGGGVDIVKADVTITNTVISKNIAMSAVGAGGISSNSAALTVNNSRITDNLSGGFGGGMYLNKGITTLKDTSINANIAADAAANGGGIFAYNAEIKFVGLVEIKNNSVNISPNNLCLLGNIVFDKTDILSAGSEIGMSFYDAKAVAAIANISSANLEYFKSDDPAKMFVADGSGGLLYKDKPKITFDDNFSGGAAKTQTFDPNAPFTLESNPFTRDGYAFLGWSTSSLSGEVAYTDGQQNVTFAGDTTLYAVWHENHDGIEFMPVHSLSDISGSGGNYVLVGSFTRADFDLSSGTTNLCLRGQTGLRTINVSGSANLNVCDCADNSDDPGIMFIKVQSAQSTLTVNGGFISRIEANPAKEVYISGGVIGQLNIAADNFDSDAIVKIFISGTPTFEEYWISEKGIVISTAYDTSGKVTRGATIVLSNGKAGAEKVSYQGDPIEVILEYATGLSAPLFGQVVAEDVLESQKELIKLVGSGGGKLDYKLSLVGDKLVVGKLDLFDGGVKFYRNNLWDTFRSPAYPSSNRPFHLYDLSAPFDAKMNRIDFSDGRYVKFQQNKTYTTVADLPVADKSRIVNSLKYSTYSNEEAILNALIVSEVLYNGDGTVNGILANVGLIWSLGEQGFLYTSMDADGAFPYSGGIGTYVTFKAHNDGDSIVDSTPQDDPLSKDDFDPDGDGNGTVEIPTLPDTVPPANNDIYLNYLGKVIDNNGNPLNGVDVNFTYSGNTFTVTTDASGYFIISNFLLTSGQYSAAVSLSYSSGGTVYGTKTYLGMPIATTDAVTYIYPITVATDDGAVQPPPHTLTAIDYLAPACNLEGNLAHYICQDTACGCGKIFGDAQGQREITANEIVIAKIPHTAQEIPAVGATCTQNGLSAGSKCSVCDEVLIAQTVTDKIPHTAQEIPEVSATCTQNGLSAGSICSACNEILTAQTVTDKIPHTAQELQAVTATCTKTGLTAGSICSACNEILTAQTVTDKIPHTAQELQALAATCTQNGLSAGSKCSACNEILTAQTVTDKIPHTAEEVAAVGATCAQNGLSAGSICSVCDEVLVEQTVIAKLGHAAEEIPAVGATCTQTGLSAGSKCSVCAEVLTAQTILPMTEHSLDSGEITIQPTIDEEGEKIYTCTVCGHTKVEILSKLSGEDKGDISLLWLIILLAIINVLELAVIILLLFRKRSNKKMKNDTKLNCCAALPLLLMSGQVIASHIALTVTFGATAILQAAVILVLALKRRKDKLSKVKMKSPKE